jgi:hypothetical protein
MNNIEQMKVLIGQLEALGQVEVNEQLTALKTKVAELEAKAIADAHTDLEQVKEELPIVEVAVDDFFAKYRVELIVTAVIILSHIVTKFGY